MRRSMCFFEPVKAQFLTLAAFIDIVADLLSHDFPVMTVLSNQRNRCRSDYRQGCQRKQKPKKPGLDTFRHFDSQFYDPEL